MKRLILTFLLVLLPLQFAQAAVCSYCCIDEMTSSTQHDDGAQPDVELEADDQEASVTHDTHPCGFCNMSQAKFINSEAVLSTASTAVQRYLSEPAAYQSYIPRGLDRPNWSNFA